MHSELMVPDHDTQYKENPSSHNGGTCKDALTGGLKDWVMEWLMDGLMDWTLSCDPWFWLGLVGNNKHSYNTMVYKSGSLKHFDVGGTLWLITKHCTTFYEISCSCVSLGLIKPLTYSPFESSIPPLNILIISKNTTLV